MKIWAVIAVVLAATACTAGESRLFPGTQANPVLLATNCDADMPDDLIDLNAMEMARDTLRLSASYSGGCGDHLFAACWRDGAFLESFPVQARLEMHHDARGDHCEALITRDIFVDIAILKEAYQKAYQSESGLIEVSIVDTDLNVMYSF